MAKVNAEIDINFGDLPETLGEVKKEFKDLSKTIETLVKDSDQYNAVLKRMGELKGEIQGFKNDLKALNPEEVFKSFQGVLNGIVGGFAAATGAVALFGAENEELEKTLIKVNGAIALLAGFQSLQDGIKDLRLLLGLTNPELAILIGSLAAAGAAFAYLSTQMNRTSEEQKVLNSINKSAIEFYVKEKVAIETLLAEAQKENTTKQRKKEIIQELNQISPLYFGGIKSEKDLQDKATEAVAKYIKALELKAKAQAANDLLVKAEQPIIERQIKLEEDLASMRNATFASEEQKAKNIQRLSQIIKDGTDTELLALQKSAEPIKNIVADINKQLDEIGGDPNGTRNQNYVQSIADYQAYLDELEKRAQATDEKIKRQFVQIVDINAIAEEERKRSEAIAKATGSEQFDVTKIKNPITGLNLEQSMALIQAHFEQEQLLISQQRAQGLLSETEYNEQISQLKATYLQQQSDTLASFGESNLDIQQQQADASIEIARLELQHKQQIVSQVGQLLNAASQLAGQNTAAGKALAIASTTISTYTSAQQAYHSQFLPIPDPSSPIRGTIAAAVAIAAGLARVKQILSVKIPGKGAGGSSYGSPSALGGTSSYTPPSIGAATQTTNLSGNSLAEIQNRVNTPIRAVVVESDITNAQGRVRGYETQGSI